MRKSEGNLLLAIRKGLLTNNEEGGPNEFKTQKTLKAEEAGWLG